MRIAIVGGDPARIAAAESEFCALLRVIARWRQAHAAARDRIAYLEGALIGLGAAAVVAGGPGRRECKEGK